MDSKYAGDQGYALEKETYARCTVVIPDFEKTVFDFFDEFFKDENGLEKVFGTTLPVLQSNDIMIGNLE